MNGYEASAAIRALESTATAGVPTRAPTLLNGRIPILAVSASLLERQREQIASVGIGLSSFRRGMHAGSWR